MAGKAENLKIVVSWKAAVSNFDDVIHLDADDIRASHTLPAVTSKNSVSD